MATIYSPVDAPEIQWPASVSEALDGWHWGAHVSLTGRSGHYMIRDEDDAIVIAIERPDLSEDDAPSEADLLAAIREYRRSSESQEV